MDTTHTDFVKYDETLTAFLNNAPMLIAILSDSRFVYVNNYAAKALGTEDVSQIIGCSVFDFIKPEFKTIVENHLHKIEKTKIKNEYIELKLKSLLGEERIVQGISSPIRYKDDPAVLLMGKDLTNEKKMVDSLKESERKFRQLVEKLPDIIYKNDIHGNFLYMNPAGFEKLKYTPEEIYQMNYIDLFPENYKNQERDFYQKQLTNQLHETYHEIPIIRKDGTLIWIGQNVILVKENERTFFYGLARDITDRIKMENALVESEEKYRTILEQGNEFVIIMDDKGDILYESRSVANILGFSGNKAIGHNVFTLMHPEDIGHMKQSLETCINNPGELFVHKFRYPNKNKEERWMEMRGRNLLMNPAINGVLLTIRDITEQVKAENILIINEEKYRLLTENSSDIIWVLDIESFKFTYLSPSIEKVSGYTLEEGFSGSVKNVFPEADLKKMMQLLNYEFERDKKPGIDLDRTITFEAQQNQKNGDKIWVEINAKYLRDASGRIIALQGSTRDVTQRRQIEYERNKFAENIEAAKRVQQSILPHRAPDTEIANIAFRNLPMEELGGDYFSFVNFQELNNLGIFIGDVSGHGVPAALYTMMVKSVTDRLYRKYSINPSRFLEELNNELCIAMTDHFLTGIYGFFSYGDVKDSVDFNFASGGHPYPILYKAETNTAGFLNAKGKALGFFNDLPYGSTKISIFKGDRIFLYTDGLIEAVNSEKEIFGFERFLKLVEEKSKNPDLNLVLDEILEEINKYQYGPDQEDDIVLIGIEIK